MSDKLKVMTIVGTRPELIKLSRVIAHLDQFTNQVLVHTGQNFSPELSDIFFRDLDIRMPDVQLKVAGSTTMETIGRVLTDTDQLFAEERPDAVLIYGDTNSCLAAYAAKRRQIPVFHMEAGNRCSDERAPEEINRRLLDHICDVNLPVTENARRILLLEGLREDFVIKVGSTLPEVIRHQMPKVNQSTVLSTLGLEPHKYYVASLHREENVDSIHKLARLVENLNSLQAQTQTPIVLSLHPRTRQRIEAQKLSFTPGVLTMPPFCFSDYLFLQKNALCVLSDSGTLTEEAAILGFAAVMLRDSHERPEGMDAGVATMAGPTSPLLIEAVQFATTRSKNLNPVRDYQDVNVADKIVNILLSYTPYVLRTKYFVNARGNRSPNV